MTFLEMFISNYDAFLFYTGILVIVYFNRNKLEKQASLIYLYKTKIGINLMDKITKKFGKLVKILGYVGIFLAYIGFFIVLYAIFQSALDIVLQKPGAMGGGPALPGFEIPGLGIKIPLITGWISLLIIMIVHEFGHGVVARAYNVKVKSSGVGVLGPLPIAFVEPDEKELVKRSHKVQHSIFAAGPFANILLWIICIGLLFGTAYMVRAITYSDGVTIGIIQNESLPAYNSGLPDNSTIIKINEMEITTIKSLQNALDTLYPEQEITIETKTGIYDLVTTKNPDNTSKAYVGIWIYGEDRHLKKSNFLNNLLHAILLWLVDLFWWTQFLSINIGLINLFPVFITDGARMLKLNIEKLFKKNAMEIWKYANLVGLLLIIILLLQFFSDVVKGIMNILLSLFF